jgi:hypothetical protein
MRRATERAGEVFSYSVNSRRLQSYLMLIFMGCLVLVPTVLAPSWLLLLPFSVPLVGSFLWQAYCVAVDRPWRISISRRKIRWDGSFNSKPNVVLVKDVAYLVIDRRQDNDSHHPWLRLRMNDGSERAIPSCGADCQAFAHALQQVSPSLFVRYLG